jgi:hypothetical protein
MKHIKGYKIFESDNSSIWNEIEDILIPIKDDGVLYFKVQNFKYVSDHTEPWNPAGTITGSVKPRQSVSSLLIKKDWNIIKDENERYFDINDVKDELNHLCSRFPDIINQIQIFRTRARNPSRYTTQEFIKESPTGTTFLIAMTFKIKKEGAESIPR